MKRWIKIALLLFAVGFAGFLVAASGLVPIKASSGHFFLTEWMLRFSMHRSVATHSLGVEKLKLDEPGLVLRGAGHYETACRPCHGSPEKEQPRIARAMLPTPSDLSHRAAEWKPEQLFYILKHGMKFTGMPAWPTQERDDEVRAVVAFLVKLPGLDANAYHQLVHGDVTKPSGVAPLTGLLGPQSTPQSAAACARCHGKDGNGRGPNAFPRLAGQRSDYLYRALRAYALDDRHSGMMQPIAAALTEGEMHDLAEYYSRLPQQPAEVARSEQLERGRQIAENGLSSARVPACVECHGPVPRRRNPAYPLLSGQFPDYLVQQLELFKMQKRGGSAFAHLMKPIATRLSRQQMEDVALYYSSLSAANP